jgi:hypothetical protein
MNEEKCKCGHSSEMHNSLVSIHKDGELLQKGEKNGKCMVTVESVCSCKKYIKEEDK